MQVPTSITTPRLVLRAPRPGDGAALFDALLDSLDALRRFPAFLRWAMEPPSLHVSETFCQRAAANFVARIDLTYWVLLRSSGTLIGATGLRPLNTTTASEGEIGFWRRTGYGGQGYMAEAVNAVTHMALHHWPMNRVMILTDNENTPAHRLCERLGYISLETRWHERRTPEGDWRHTRVYEKTLALPD